MHGSENSGKHMTTKADISNWFSEGFIRNATHLIVVCDSFDYEDYPVYVFPEDDFWEKYKHFDGKNMQRIMEVYDLKEDKESQLGERQSWRLPPK